MKTKLIFSAITGLLIAILALTSCSSEPVKKAIIPGQDTTDHEANRLLPKKLRGLPYGLFGSHDPNPTFADFEDSMYVWKHNTTIQSVVGDLTLIEYGSFVWTDNDWYQRVSYTAKDFDEHYGCKNGELKAGIVYTDPKSWRRQEVLTGGDAMWYYIAKDKNGKLWKGIALIETEGVLRKVATDTNAFQFSGERSRVTWTGYGEVGDYSLTGTVPLKSGWCRFAGTNIAAGEVVIQMNGITHSSENLVEHLKGEDFFYTEKYPESLFVLQTCSEAGKDSVLLTGALSLRGVTKTISCKAAITRFDSECRIAGSFLIDRTQFEIKYGSSSFFGNLGDQAIRNTMRLDVYLVGQQQGL
ncbi:MAG: YceI family protein [Bacteroidia bacterium]